MGSPTSPRRNAGPPTSPALGEPPQVGRDPLFAMGNRYNAYFYDISLLEGDESGVENTLEGALPKASRETKGIGLPPLQSRSPIGFRKCSPNLEGSYDEEYIVDEGLLVPDLSSDCDIASSGPSFDLQSLLALRDSMGCDDLNPNVRALWLNSPRSDDDNSTSGGSSGSLRQSKSVPSDLGSYTEENTTNGIPCKFYLSGFCSKGDACAFYHPSPTFMHDLYLKPHAFSDLSVDYYEHGPLDDVSVIAGKVNAMCRDQHGCRYLQKKLDEGNEEIVQIIYGETFDYLADLMVDPFGNYLCQKLVEKIDPSRRSEIILSVAPSLATIAMNMHGTRAVQKVIELVSSPDDIHAIRTALADVVVPLIKDLNGNHVIQKCLFHMSADENQFIYESVAKCCVEVAKHRHGCCVMQRCIDHASQGQRLLLVDRIRDHALELVQDPYGNYVVQYALDLEFPALVQKVIGPFVGHMDALSTQKFSSNVIEKCLHVANARNRSLLVLEIAACPALNSLIKDPYANYVIQTALSVSSQSDFNTLSAAIRPHLASLRNTPYGKRIQSRMNRNHGGRRRGKKR